MPGLSGQCDCGLATCSKNWISCRNYFNGSERPTLNSSQKSTNILEGYTVPGAYCVSRGNNKKSQETEGSMDMVGTEGQRQTTELPGPVYLLQAAYLCLCQHCKASDQTQMRDKPFSGPQKQRSPSSYWRRLSVPHPSLAIQNLGKSSLLIDVTSELEGYCCRYKTARNG
jgi:hypothetical protein